MSMYLLGAINIAQQVSGEFWQPHGMNVFGNVILQELFGLVSIESQSVADCRRERKCSISAALCGTLQHPATPWNTL